MARDAFHAVKSMSILCLWDIQLTFDRNGVGTYGAYHHKSEYNLVIGRGRQRATGAYKRGRALPEVIQAASNGGRIQIHERSFSLLGAFTLSVYPLYSKRCLHVKHLVALRTRLCGIFTVLEKKIHKISRNHRDHVFHARYQGTVKP